MNDLPKGPGAERNANQTNQPGVYELKRDGQDPVRIITSPGSTGLNEGGTQADALVRLGFVRVGDVPSREELLAAQQSAPEAEEASAQSKKNDSK